MIDFFFKFFGGGFWFLFKIFNWINFLENLRVSVLINMFSWVFMLGNKSKKLKSKNSTQKVKKNRENCKITFKKFINEPPWKLMIFHSPFISFNCNFDINFEKGLKSGPYLKGWMRNKKWGISMLKNAEWKFVVKFLKTFEKLRYS